MYSVTYTGEKPLVDFVRVKELSQKQCPASGSLCEGM